MKFYAIQSTLVVTAAAFPNMGARQAVPKVADFPMYPGTPNQALFNEFDATEQLVSVHGEHEYRDPRPGDIRGPCPGLNAAANHGYLPRDGIATYAAVQTGLWEAFGLDQTATQFLQQTTTLFDGDPLSQKWSIGYASDKVSLLGPVAGALLGTPTGICAYGHSKSENDASITRGDFLAPDDNSNCASYPKFYQELLDLSDKRANGLITAPVLAEHQHNRKLHSIATNPNYFSPAFGGVAFTPAAHTFVWALMANHSSANPRGFLEHNVLDAFFSYSVQPDGSRKYEYGKDRIPENWYRRSHKNPWTLVDIVLGVASQCLAFPSTCKVGGNTGTVNSFDGIDLGDISGGLINSIEDFQDPARLACFIGQNIQAEAPSSLEKIFTGELLKEAVGLVGPVVDMLGKCPNMPPGKSVNQYGSKYPGANKHKGDRGKTAKDTHGYPADAP
ncbi:Putative Peroxidase, family 2 domain-containing protein [[Torrubiella] hemipterigena]|uniref:Putative Peroxidase, family 2 domain-containing protein n=1 Tax=[Torrubiella] hemipterigena TaxID=1531966 RepID=A0A0A1SR34_9HYPO|nr:Putative Peroxidase, family 2 domain-containing protein [[Torrubiella] hemipterigena]